MNYFKILHALQYGDRGQFDIPVREQKNFLESLGEATDNIDRGYKQYCCQCFFVPKWKTSIFNLLSAIILPSVVLFNLVRFLFTKKSEAIEAIIERKGMDETIPNVVKEKYHPDNRYWHEGTSMSFSDIPFLWKLLTKAFSQPFFVFKSWMNVMYYSHMIRRHTPKVIIQYGEFSFSSSILTEYCHIHGIKHYNIMHGEKLWFIRDAYFHYDRCYVWDEHYAKLFMELKAAPDQFVIAIPPSLHIDCYLYQDKKMYADYKYYLADYDEDQLRSIVESMSFALNDGKSVKYRPHPRYSDLDILKKYVSMDEIEFPYDVNIMESISNLEYAVGSYTTVLNQSFFSGKKVLLDDVTFNKQYEKLKEMKYLLSEKGVGILSEKVK